ncbi:MAG: S8 family serine peptidase [candidate division WOR-3 bacterium]
MKKEIIGIFLFLIFSFSYSLISPELSEIIKTAKDNELIPINIILKEQFDSDVLNRMVDGLPKKIRRVEVARILKTFSYEKQANLVSYLKAKENVGKVNGIVQLWIGNIVHCKATKDVILEVEKRDDVWFVDNDLKYCPNLLPKPQKGDITKIKDAITYGVRKIRAPEVWALGYTGQGIVVGLIDTGVNYNHLDLRDHMWEDPNYPYHGWNFEQNNNNPIDNHGHGTHCAGTIASDGTAGTQCGVAPDAQIMALRVRTVADTIAESQVWQAMEFVISPPLSPENGGDLISMSLGWMISWNPRQAIWRTNCNNVGAAGIPMIVAAGNEQYISPPNSCRCPGNVPSPWRHPQNGAQGAQSDVISIGATDSLDNIASFSSRGPVTWQNVPPFNDYPYPPGLKKPDVSAPGVDVLSCDYQNNSGYRLMSGTSMATPHVAGTVALMLSKNPELTPREIDSILQTTAVDLGLPGKDTLFGAGRIDAYNAVMATPLPTGVRYYRHIIVDNPPNGNGDGIINPGEEIEMPLWVINRCDYQVLGVWGKLVLDTIDPNITITDSVKYFGNIAAGESAYTGEDGYNFQVSSACTNGYSIKFNLELRDTLDSLWISPLELKVGTPILEPRGVIAWDSPPGGNNNGKVDPGETAYVAVGIKNTGLGNGYNVYAILKSGDPRFIVLDSFGTYGTILVDSVIYNQIDRYKVYASSSIPREFPVPCTLIINSESWTFVKPFYIVVGEVTIVDPIPDGPRVPARYWAYDNIDTFYVECPEFEWVEIRDIGVQLPITGDDQTIQFNLPFPFKYYGTLYTGQFSICGNGWITPEYTTSTVYINQPLPDPTTTNPSAMICVNWDDLYPPYGNGIWFYYDTLNHRMILEWDSVHYYNPREQWDKFQIIIYDTTVRTYTGDNEIVFQYLTANNYISNTVGIEDQTNTIGINALYNNTYHRACAPIVAGRAIKITTDTVAYIGIKEFAKRLENKKKEIIVANPQRILKMSLPFKEAEITVFDVFGRKIKEFKVKDKELVWDFKDTNGRKLGAGIYTLRIKAENNQVVKKIIHIK